MTIRHMALATILGIGALGLAAVPARAEVVPIHATMDGAHEVPPKTTNGKGTMQGTYDTTSHKLTYTVTYSGLTGPATMAHFHGPAGPGVNAPVVVPIAGATSSPATGSATLTEAQGQDLLNGRMYVNVHTAANPGGEIRGQVEHGK